MNKMQLAHEMALELVKIKPSLSAWQIADRCFEYANAMQAEAEKREDKTRPKALLTKDKDGKCLHFNHEFGHKKCMDCGASLEEWQPDWSQAPDGVTGWSMRADGNAIWHYYYGTSVIPAPSFGYQGNWQDSLRKLPESIKNIDPKEYIDAVLQDIVDPCDHEWTHISKFGAEGDFYVCPCGAKSKHARGRK